MNQRSVMVAQLNISGFICEGHRYLHVEFITFQKAEKIAFLFFPSTIHSLEWNFVYNIS